MVAATALVSGLVLFSACVPIWQAGPQAPLPEDPATLGPFNVGVTTRSVSRTLTNGQQRTVPSLIWYPANVGANANVDPGLRAVQDAPPMAAARNPLVIFSHGHTGNPQGSSFLLSHLASFGFVVVGPMHRDCSTNCPTGSAGNQGLQRVDDVRSVLDDVLSRSAGDDPILKNMVDPYSIGMAGWSQGGFTTLKAMEGDRRFLAGFVLAPATLNPPAPDPTKVSNPMMFVNGELDSQVPFTVTESFYTKIPESAGDHWLIDIPNTGHSYAGICLPDFATLPCSQTLSQKRVHDIVNRVGTAFLLRYVARNDRYASLLDAPSPDPDYEVVHTKSGTETAALPTPSPFQSAPADSPLGPSAAPGTLLFHDGADRDGKLTMANADTNRSGGYSGAEYALKTMSVSPSISAQGATHAEAVAPASYADASFEADARVTDSAPDRYVNIACRSQDLANEFRLMVFPGSGQFQVTRWWHAQSISLTGLHISAAIQRGTAVNHLQLSCYGTRLDAFINATRVASVTDNTYSAGRVTIGAGQWFRGDVLGGLYEGDVESAGNKIEARFSNLEVKQQ